MMRALGVSWMLREFARRDRLKLVDRGPSPVRCGVCGGVTRVLLTGQIRSRDNGVYTVTGDGLARASDNDPPGCVCKYAGGVTT